MTVKGHNFASVQAIKFKEAQPYCDAGTIDAVRTVDKFSHEEAFKVSTDAFISRESVQFIATI